MMIVRSGFAMAAPSHMEGPVDLQLATGNGLRPSHRSVAVHTSIDANLIGKV